MKISFEFFPPATPAGTDSFRACVAALAPLRPEFVSVTYGAGGSTQNRTIDAIVGILESTDLPVAGHLTCVGKSRAEVGAVVDTYDGLGLRHIVALRGDPPEGSATGRHPEGYADAAELVAGIRARNDMTISVAAYPEVHPKAASAQADLDNLKRKLDAGATQAITQFFFETETFLRFYDRARSAGIDAPILPGIMPITNFAGIRRFAERCGTSIPQSLVDRFAALGDAPADHATLAATVAARQCQDLMDQGIRDFHFYTMNKPQVTMATCELLGIRPTIDA